jgi:hypothetical protein
MYLRGNKRMKDGKEHCYYTIVESRQVGSGRVVQKQVLYLGEINDSQQTAWRKTLEVFDEQQQRLRPLSLFAEDSPVPAEAPDSVQVKLSEMKLQRARAYGNRWLGCRLWEQLQLDRFWSGKLPQGRETVAWAQVLELLVVNRLIDPFAWIECWSTNKSCSCICGNAGKIYSRRNSICCCTTSPAAMWKEKPNKIPKPITVTAATANRIASK